MIKAVKVGQLLQTENVYHFFFTVMDWKYLDFVVSKIVLDSDVSMLCHLKIHQFWN